MEGPIMAKQMAPDLGTWKLNIAKSTFKLTPAIKSETAKVEPWENGRKFSADIVDAQGNKMRIEATFKFDGKDYPIKGSPMLDAVSAKRIGERGTESVLKKDGKVILSAKSVISFDG